MIDPMSFKIRCSQIGLIMTNPKSEHLPKTCKSYLDQWIKASIYNRKKDFFSKYTEKGNVVEENSIDFIAKMLGYGFLVKNETSYENDYMTGTPDILPPDNIVIDAKNSWDWSTFPLLEDYTPTKGYYGQLQGYMQITGMRKAKLVYTLIDTPGYLIEREARQYCYNNGFDDLDIEVYISFENRMKYKDIPDNLKIKIFDVVYDPIFIKEVEKRVDKCREYIADKIKTLKYV